MCKLQSLGMHGVVFIGSWKAQAITSAYGTGKYWKWYNISDKINYAMGRGVAVLISFFPIIMQFNFDIYVGCQNLKMKEYWIGV